jgi:hypothetical protein
MKSVITLLAVLFVGFTLPDATQQGPLHFAVPEWDFGEIREEAGPVTHTFEFTNTGSAPVAIDRVTASCGCTTPDYPKTPIAPGAKAHIKVTFDPMGLPGDNSKIVTIVSGGGTHRNYLTVSARVTPRPRTVEEDYPHDMGGGVRLSTTLVTHRSVARGNASSMTTKWINTADRALTLAFNLDEVSGRLDIHSPATLCAGCRGEITFTYDLSNTAVAVYGPLHDVVRPVIDGAPSKKTIYVSATAIDSFTGVDLATAPKLFFDALFHNFGEVRRRPVPYTFRLTASNEGAQTLHIRSVTPGRGLDTTLREGMTLAPGASLPFEVMFYGNRFEPGEVQSTIQIVTDDPMRPVREIRVAAIIK